MRFTMLGSLTLLAVTAGIAPAAPPAVTDPATLVPEDTLFYAEVQQPGRLLKNVDDLFKGSALANVPDSLVRFRRGHERGRAGSHRPDEALGVLGVALSPELRQEMERIQGAAVAWTGAGSHGRPHGVFIVLTGKTPMPALLMRTFLAVSAVPLPGSVDGVILYREASHLSEPAAYPATPVAPPGVAPPPPPPGAEVQRRPPGVRARPAAGDPGPVFAMLPHVLLVGTPDAVREVIHRVKGKAEGRSLAETADFQQARQHFGNDAGLFGYASVPNVVEAMRKAQGPRDAERMRVMLQFINPKAYRYEALHLTLDDGNLRYRQYVQLDPKEKSPLAELLPGKPVETDLLHFAPRDALVAAIASNDNGEKRWDRFVKLMDQVAEPQGKHPSEEIDQAEQGLDLKIGKEIAGRVRQVGFALGNPVPMVTNRNGEGMGPMAWLSLLQIMVRAEDDKAADALIKEVLPKILRAANQGEEKETSSAKVDGQTVHVVQAGPARLHFGREGKTIVFGFSRKTVAAALNGGAKKEGLLAEKKVQDATAHLEHPVGLVVSQPLPMMMSWFLIRSGPAEPAAEPAATVVPMALHQAPQERHPAKGGDAQQQRVQEFLKIAAEMGPSVMGLANQPDHMLFEFSQTGLKPATAKFTNWLLARSLESRSSPPPQAIEGAVPAPAVPRRVTPPRPN